MFLKTNVTIRAILSPAAACFLILFFLNPSAHAVVIGHWTFNEGAGGTATDTSGNGNDGAIGGGAIYVATPGLSGISLDGDNGAQSGINFGTGGGTWNFLGNPHTFAAWVAVDTDAGNGNNEWIFGMSDSSWRIGFKSDGGADRVQVFVPGVSESAAGQLEPAFSFHHILVSKEISGNGYEWYIDAVPQNSPGGAAAIPDNAGAILQSGFGGGNALVSIMDELTIWDTALSAQEVLDLYNAGPSLVPNASSVAFVNRTDLGSFDSHPLGWNDYNQDGRPDFSVGGPLLRNEGGTNLVSVQAGFGTSIWADWDNDGDQDSFNMNLLAQPKFMRTDGIATFVELPVPALTGGMDNQGACWADFNGDTYLDIYVGAYEETGYEPDSVLMNNAGASFTRVLVESGGDRPGRGVTACDFDKDGDMDVFVSNYRLEANYLWRNDGFGGFTDAAPALGADGLATSNPDWNYAHTIGSAWGDMNNDGHFDIFVGNFAHPAGFFGCCTRQPESQFLENQGPPTYNFVDRANLVGLHYQESYASASLADYDNNGHLDFYLSAVNAGDAGVLYRNNGNWSFTDVTAGEGLSGLANSSQAAWADWNDDGFLDLMADGNLFENQGNSNHWLKVRMEGDGTNINRSAIGTQVRIDLGDGTILSRQVEAGTGHGNQNSPILHFGLGTRTAPVTLDVFWPDGTTAVLPGVAVDQTEFVSYGPSPPVPPIVFSLLQSSIGEAVGLCFTGQVGALYGLSSADLIAGPYADTGARVTGTGGSDCLFDPNHATGIETSKFYRIDSPP